MNYKTIIVEFVLFIIITITISVYISNKIFLNNYDYSTLKTINARIKNIYNSNIDNSSIEVEYTNKGNKKSINVIVGPYTKILCSKKEIDIKKLDIGMDVSIRYRDDKNFNKKKVINQVYEINIIEK